MILFVGLVLRGRAEPKLEETADGILRHLSLLFVPAGVGVVQYLGLIADEWLPAMVALIVSTVVTIVVTAGAMRLLGRFATAREEAW